MPGMAEFSWHVDGLTPAEVAARMRIADRLRAVLTERIDAMFDLIDELGRDLAVPSRG